MPAAHAAVGLSSRRLEREAGRNVELMWLTGRLAPDFKTIADFRRDNGPAIQAACPQFVVLCRQLGLLAGGIVALDGSRFKAVNARPQLHPGGGPAPHRAGRGEHRAKGTGMVGYNVQAVVDTGRHLIVAHAVTTTGHDRTQLAHMSRQGQAATGHEALSVLADRGYFSGEEILACAQVGIAVTLPRPLTSGAKAEGRFGKQDFVYEPEADAYRCPAGERLSYRYTNVEGGLTLRRDWTTACRDCTIEARGTPAQERRVTRWEHEAVLEAVQRRLDKDPHAMRTRRQTVEHVFGTLKDWMGATHFRMRRLRNVATEMSLQVPAYNRKRIMALLGTGPLLTALPA
ncbi:transposase [Methylobacterium sp. P1-11]|uniref:transposase n=1 Tax=Methylobacterium sp. P1-11 TaxID=2024616 RepID=UPI001FEEC2F0|nr:transposase [Methylobacterium sp. P1-11]